MFALKHGKRFLYELPSYVITSSGLRREHSEMGKAKKLRGSFRSTAWDPLLLTSQIAAVQALLYCSLALLVALAQDAAGAARSLDHIFHYHELHVRDFEGRAIVTAYLVNAVIGAFVLWMLVGRTKLCLDFSCTYYGIHMLVCWWYNTRSSGVTGDSPGGVWVAGGAWWCVQACCAVITCVAAEFLCLRTELQAIPLSNIGAKVDL